jgi:hypothetical protein
MLRIPSIRWAGTSHTTGTLGEIIFEFAEKY